MKIQKVLSNNAAIVREHEEEKVALGPGIGFQKKRGEFIDETKVEKVFTMEEKEKQQFSKLMDELPEALDEAVREIVRRAESALGVKFADHLYIALLDHIHMALERIQAGQVVNNQLLPEIQALYPEEMDVALWGAHKLEEKMGVAVPDAEAGFIALHLHTARAGRRELSDVLQVARAVKGMVHAAERQAGATFKAESPAYAGLMNHLQIALRAYLDDEKLEGSAGDMHDVMQVKYPEAYRAAVAAWKELHDTWQIELPQDEIIYMAMHIQRLLQRTEETL